MNVRLTYNTPTMIDPMLANLVRAVETADRDGRTIGEIPIVLHMGGTLILGDLIPERQFAEASKELVKRIYDITERAIEDLVVTADLTLDAVANGAVNYIHLKDVTFRIPGGDEIPENSAEHWRGRLDRVDGFVLGVGL